MNLKLILPTILVCLVAAIIGWSGYNSLVSVTNQFSLISDQSLPSIRAADEMFLQYRKIRISLRTLGLPGLSKETAETAVHDTLTAIHDYEQADEAYRKLESSEEGKQTYEKVQAAWVAFKAVGVQVLELHKTGSEADRHRMVEIFFKDCPEAAKAYTAAINELVAFQQKQASMRSSAAHHDADSARTTITWTLSIGLSVGVAVSIFSARSASRLVASIARIADELAHGADQVSQVATSVSGASESLSKSSTHQSSALQQTTAAVEQTSEMVGKNAENARRSKEISEQSQSTVERGKRSVTDVISAIGEISESNGNITRHIEETNREMADILNVIEEIGNKTKVINDIVFQTRLLSFNASVEAARAGEHGKGFAVVAEEVGSLAQKSGSSAKEISALLETSTKKVEGVVEQTKSRMEKLVSVSSEKVQRGTEVAQECQSALDEIVVDATQIGQLVSEIATASQEQANGVDEISKAIGELDSAAQQNSHASSQSAENAENLKQQVYYLRQMISDLNALVKAGDEKSDHPRSPAA